MIANWHEVHIDSRRAKGLAHLLPDLRLNSKCDPANVPVGTSCYEYPSGREGEFNRLADALAIEYAWGIISQKVVASALITTSLYILSSPTNSLSIIDVSDPTNMIQGPSYDLNSVFAIQQVAPSAIVSNVASNLVYVQNADDSLVPSAPSFFVVYNVTNPLVVTQGGSINLGVPTAQRANEGNSLVASGTTIWSLLGGDSTVNAAKLRKINASNPLAPVVSVGSVSVGTFADQPRKLALSADGNTLYVLSGTPTLANQKVFVYNAMTLGLIGTLLISDAAALVGLHNFTERDGLLYMIAGDGIASDTNFLIYDTSGVFKSATNITSGPSGLAVATGTRP